VIRRCVFDVFFEQYHSIISVRIIASFLANRLRMWLVLDEVWGGFRRANRIEPEVAPCSKVICRDDLRASDTPRFLANLTYEVGWCG